MWLVLYEQGDSDKILLRSRGLKVGRSGAIAAKKVRVYAEEKLGSILLDGHRATPVTQEDINWADVILYMDGGNRKRLERCPGAIEKSVCLANYVQATKIPDPNYLPRGPELEEVLDLAVTAAQRFLVDAYAGHVKKPLSDIAKGH